MATIVMLFVLVVLVVALALLIINTGTSTRYRTVAEVIVERRAQDAKWGEQNHADGTGGSHYWADRARNYTDRRAEAGTLTWRNILNEEIEEAYAESDYVALRTELIQVAAVAVAWVEAIDRRPE